MASIGVVTCTCQSVCNNKTNVPFEVGIFPSFDFFPRIAVSYKPIYSLIKHNIGQDRMSIESGEKKDVFADGNEEAFFLISS